MAHYCFKWKKIYSNKLSFYEFLPFSVKLYCLKIVLVPLSSLHKKNYIKLTNLPTNTNMYIQVQTFKKGDCYIYGEKW